MSDYSGKDQFSVLFPVFEYYDIVRKLGAIIADNIFLNNVLYRIIETYLDVEHKIKWKVDYWRIRCIGYIINLAV